MLKNSHGKIPAVSIRGLQRIAADTIGLVVACLLLISVNTESAEAQTFVPSCERIGPTTVSIVNNEFSPLGKFATWGRAYPVSQASNWSVDYWLTAVTDAGKFDPADGFDYQINAGMPWGTFAYWGRDAVGSAIYTSDSSFSIQRIRVDEDTGAISPERLAGPLDRRPQYIYPSRIQNAADTYLVYYKAKKVNGRTYFEIFWIDGANPTIENRLIHLGTPHQIAQEANSNARWVPGLPVFVYPFVDAGGVIQVGAYNVVDGTYLVLTTDAGNKADPFPFVAPEYPGDWFLATVVGTNRIAIYRVAGGSTSPSLLKTIDIPSVLLYEQSAETFVWDGKTYIATGVNKQPPGSRVTAPQGSIVSELWIADIDPASTFSRKVNTSSVKWTLDPETLVSPTGVWMTGYQKKPTSKMHELQKCKTGLGN